MSDFFIERLRETEERTGGNRQLTEYGMASGFLLMLFGEEWYERRVRPRPDDPVPWMLNGDDSWLVRNPIPNDVRRIVHRQRVIRLTNALFTLASPSLVEGFKHLLTRLVNRIMEACFFETEIASMFRHTAFKLRSSKRAASEARISTS